MSINGVILDTLVERQSRTGVFKVDTINIHTKVNSIEPKFDDIDGERGLFIYLYVAYANYSKTWIERIVQDETNGN